MEIFELKIITFEIKFNQIEFYSRVNTREKGINEHKNRVIKVIKTEKQKKNWKRKKQDSMTGIVLSDLLHV